MTLRTLAPVGEAHDSLCYAPLTIRGITSSSLCLFGLETVVDDEAGAIFWRVPVELADGAVVSSLLVPICDPADPVRLRWEGPRRPDLLYGAWMVAPGEPIVIVPGLSHVWLLSSLDIRACTFLCSPRQAPPPMALAQIAAGRPACGVVLDNGEPGLPSGALAVARALRAVGVMAGAFAVPDLFHGAFPATVSDWVQSVGRTREAVMSGLCTLDVRGRRAAAETRTLLHLVRAA